MNSAAAAPNKTKERSYFKRPPVVPRGAPISMSLLKEPEAVDDVALYDSLSAEERNQLRSKQQLLQQREEEGSSVAGKDTAV